MSSQSSAGAYISHYNPLSSTTGGAVTITNFANNTVTSSNANGSSSPITGGILINGATFDADLSTAGIQTVNGGSLTIGSQATPTNVVGDGLQLNDVTGKLTFTTLNISNDNGTGLYVNTKINNTTFSLTNSAGSINTTNGAAMNLDPLTANLTFSSVASASSAGNGLTLDTVAGSVNLGAVQINSAAGNGVDMSNSSANVTIGQLNVNQAMVGLNLLNNAGGSFTVTGSGGVGGGGTIQNVTAQGVLVSDTLSTSLNNMIIDASTGTRGVDVTATTGANAFTLSNSIVTGGSDQAVRVGADDTGLLNASVTNNTLAGIGPSDDGAAFWGVTSANGNSGGTLNLAFSGNTMSSMTAAGAVISTFEPDSFTQGGTINVVDFANNTVLTSNSGNASGPFTGGIITLGVTFDSDLNTAGYQAVDGGNLTIGSLGSPTDIGGAGLVLYDVRGNLQFSNVNIGNDSGTGLFVDTKTNNTTFNLSNTGGAINTTNGDALYLDPLTANLTFSSVSATDAGRAGITLDGVAGSVNLGAMTVSDNTDAGLFMDASSATVTAASVTVTNAPVGLSFGNNTGSFTVTGATSLTGITFDGIDLYQATGTYQFGDVTIGMTGDAYGLDFGRSNVVFSSANTTITGDGTLDSVGIDLSGSLNPFGANSTTSNIRVGAGAGQTAIINNVDTGVLMGSSADGSAGAYLVYGNQTPHNSGSQINVIASGLTLDTTHLTSSDGYTQGRYEFLGVSFTGTASFQQSNNMIFVGSTSAGKDDGSSPLNRIDGAQLLALDANPANLDGKTIILVNDNGGAGIDLGGSSLVLGNNTVLDSFGNGKTFTTNGTVPVNVIVDTITGGITISDPNGAGTLLNNGTADLVIAGNGDTIQNVILNGGFNTVSASGINGFDINHTVIGGSSAAGISLSNTTGTINLNQNTISNAGAAGILLSNAGTVGIAGGSIDGTGDDGIHSTDTNLTVTGMTIGGVASITGDGIEIRNNGSAHIVNLSNNLITGDASAITTRDSGVAGELLLTLDDNTLKSVNSGTLALDIGGGGLNSTIIQSMNGGTILGGTGGGASFSQVTFDASGTSLSGTQLNAGSWTIGTTSSRVQGAGLQFTSPTGDLTFSSLNVANNNGTGLSVDTKSLGTIFTLGTSGGTVDTTNGAALFLDPLNVNMTLGSVSSTNSSSAGVTLDTVGGTLSIGVTNISGSSGDGILTQNNFKTLNANFGSTTVDSASGDSINLSGDGNFTFGTTNITNRNNIGINTNGTGGTIQFGTTTIDNPNAAGDAVVLQNSNGGSTTFDSLTISNAGGIGLSAVGNAFDVNITNTLTVDGSGTQAVYLSGNSGNFTVGGLTSLGVTTANSGANFQINGGTGNITLGGLTVGNRDQQGIRISNGFAGAANFNGTTTIGAPTSATSAIDISGLAATGSATFNNLALDNTGATSSLINLTDNTTGSVTINAGTLSNLAGGIGISNTNTSLTVNSLTINGTGTQDGIYLTNNDATSRSVTLSNISSTSGSIGGAGIYVDMSTSTSSLAVNLSGNSIIAGDSALRVWESAAAPVANTVQVNLTGTNTWQSLNPVNTLDFAGQNIGADNSTIVITSLGNGTITANGTNGGVNFGSVAFDSDLSTAGNQQVSAGNWNIGQGTGANQRVQGIGLNFADPAGSAAFTTLNIYNNNDSGLNVDTNDFGTNFALATAAGTVDTTNGTALYLDPLAANLTFDQVSSTNSSTDGVTVALMSGTLNITNLQVTGASNNGLEIEASSSLTTTIQSVTISNTFNGINLVNAGAVSILGGTIDSTSGDGIHSFDTNLTAQSLNIGGTGAVTGDGIEIVNSSGAQVVNLSNNTIKANASGISTTDSAAAKALLLTLDGNTLQAVNPGNLALSVKGNGLNSTIIKSMNGGTIIGNGASGGAKFNRVTFDASGTALTGTQVAAGNWTVGTSAARVQGDGLRFDGTTGDLKFGTLNVGNNNGTGLYVDTKTLGTTFTLANASGSVDTTSGSAMFLDPLTANLTFGTVNTTGSAGNGVTFDTVGGSVSIGSLTVSNAALDGVLVKNSTGSFTITGGSIGGAGTNSFEVSGGSATVNYGGTIATSTDYSVLIDSTTGGSATFGGTITDNGSAKGIRLTNNSGDATFNGNVSLGATTALTQEALYLTNNTGNIKFGNVDITVNSATAQGAIYGLSDSSVVIGSGSVNATGAAAVNLDQSKIDMTFSGITSSGGTDGLALTNLLSGSVLKSTTTTISNVTQTAVGLSGSQGDFSLGTLGINGAKTGIDFRNSNLSFTSGNTTITGDGSAGSVAIDLSGTQNPYGANSTTPNIKLADVAGQTAIINNFGTGVLLGNAIDGSAGANFIYGDQTPLNSGSQINVISGGVTLDGTHLVSSAPYTQGRYEFMGVAFTGNTTFPSAGADLLFVGSVSGGAANGSSPTDRISIAQLLALDATPANLDGKTIVFVNDGGAGGGTSTIGLGAASLTLGTGTIVDTFGNGRTFSNGGIIAPVNVIVDTIAGTTYTDPFSNGAATLTNTGAFDLITLGNGDTVQNITLNSSGLNDIYGSGVAGVNVNNTTFGGLPGGSAINLVNTTGTITLDSNIITNSGDSGIQLSNAGTVSITNGSIDNTSWNGIDSLNTNLTVSGVTFGATSAIGGSAVSITNNDAVSRTISLQNLTSTSTSNINGNGILINSSGAGTLSVDFTGNSIAATLQALRVNETAAVAAANTVQLAFNGTNTWSNNSANYAVQLTGQNVDATNSSIVVTSLADGAITANGVGGGVSFNGVTFDSDLGTAGNQQVVAGSWNIGQGSLAAQRVQGDGLRFDAPAGDVSFTTLNIFNNNGTGLYVDTKTAGTTFNLGTGTGTIDTTNGSAMFLDPLSTNMTLASVSSTNSSSNGVTLDTVSGTLSIGNLTIDGATASGLWIDNSAGLTSTFTTVAISNIGTLPEDSGVNLTNAGTVSILGGTIDGTTGDGIHTEDSNLLASGLTIGGVGAITGDGVHIASIAGSPHTVTISNNSITSNGLAISSVDSGAAGELVLSLDGNTVQSTGSLAINVTGSALNSTIVKSMNGGTVVGNGAGGGVIFQQVTFDASGSALLGTQVDAGNWTIGTVANRVSGDGLQLYYPTGDLKFGDLNIANITGTGLFVDTKTLGTTFSLSNTGGTIDTANGSAIYLDPLTTHLTFDAISSTNSFTTGVTLDTVDGTFTVNGTTTVSNAGSHGVLINNNSGTVTFGDVNIDTTGADGVHISNNTGAINFIGTTTIQSTTGDGIDLASAGGGVNFGTTDIVGANANGINLTNATGDYTFGTTTINGFGTNKTGIDFTGAAASATFGVTNIQNGGFGTAIDLSSTTGDKTITFQTGSSISNVNLGVQLSSSNTAATTANANFTFGDGDGADPNGANSTIDATTTVNAVGLNSASGSYNFNDVTFTGTANLPGASGGALFVSATAADGVGNGSYSNPYSVADADAITTAGAQFVFLDGTYNFATLNGGHAFTLSKNQSVEGLDNGNTVTYGTVQPANIQGNLGAVGGVASRTSSLSITDGAAGGIFDLAGGNTLLDLTMSGSALTTYLINANGNTVGFDNTNGITLNGLTLSNAAGNATALQFTDLTGTVQVTGNNINMGSGQLLDLSGGTATYTIAKGTQPDPGSTTGVLNGNSIRVRNTVGGSLSLDGMSLGGAGTLVTLDNNAASFSFANNSFAGGAGSTLFDIDNNTGGSITSLVFDNTNTITQTNGTIATIGSGNRSIDLSAFDFTNTGTTNSNVIRTASQSGGTIKFGNINIVNFNNAAGTAVLLGGSGGTAQFGDLDIAATNGAGLNVGAITFNGGATPTISTSNGAALAMNGTMIAGGAMTFGSLTSNGGSNGISLTNVIGNTTFTTVNIDNSTGDGISLSNSGLVTLNGGTIDGTTNDGIHSSNTNLILDGLTIGGSSAVGGDGVQIVNSASKTVAISNTTVADAAGTGITISGSGGGTTTITAFDGNSTLSAGAGGVVFDTVTFDSNTGLAGIQQVSGGTLTVGDLVTTTNVTGDGLVLNNVLGDIAFTTLNIGNDNGTGLYIRDAAGKGGSFAFGNTGGTINTTNGSAMDIDPVTMNSTFAAVRSTNANGQGISTAGNGINLNTVTGNVTINGGSISGATAGSFVVNGGNANITYKGDITNTAGYIVEVENTTGGSVTFDTGTLSDSGTGGDSGLGIFLFNNAGNTSFTGNTLLTDSDASGIYISGGSGTNTFGPNTSITNASLFGFLISGGTASATYSGNITETSGGSGLVSAQGGHSLGTVTFDTGTLKGSSGNGLFFNNADGTYNFNGVANISNAASISIDNGSSGTFQFGTNTTVTNSTSDSFYMNNSSANVTFDGAIGQNTASAVVRISNQSAGTVTFSSGAIIVASNGSGIQLDNVDGTVNFLQTIAILGGQSTGFSVTNGSSGTILVSNSGFLIQNPTAYAYYEDTSTANVTFNGSIQKNNNGFNAILINNKTGGTTTFGGAITAINGSTNAINLTSNTGGTINFANTSGTASTIATTSGNALNFTGGGTLNFTGNKYALSSGAGTAFNATAGTVTATGTGNTLSSSSGTALNVSNATIGANNLTFQSISSGSGSNTTANGIVLDTTGTLGGLIVTGTGSAGSGGTIQHKTGSDGSATQGTGIYLNNTSGVSLSYMQLNDFQNFGIRGFNVTGFSMDNTVINGSNGTNSAGGSREGAVFFDGLYTTGSFAGAQTASITNSTIGGVGGGDQSYSDNLRIVNTSGTLNRLTINNTSFGNIGSSGNDSLSMQASNSAVMNVTVTNSTFTNAIGSLAHIIDNNSSSSDIVFRNNTLSNNNVNQASGGSGLYITGDSVGTATTVTYDISHNTIRDSIGDAMIVAKGNGKGTWSGTINANTIGVNGVSLSGSSQASGIKVYSGGTGSQTVLISNNIIYQTNETGIFIQANDSQTAGNGGGQGVMNVSVFGNQVLQPGSFQFAGLDIDVGAVSGDNTIVNVVVGNANTAGQKNDFSAGDPSDFSDVNFSQQFSTVINLSKNGSSGSTADVIIQDNNLNGINTTTAVSGSLNYVTTLPALPPVVAP